MRKLDPESIATEFNLQKQKFTDDHSKSGLLQALRDLSAAVGDIQAAGHDVTLEIFGNPSELAFSMFPGSGQITPVSGILSIGTNQHLIALSTKVNGNSALQLAMSEFDIRHHGVDGKTANGEIGNTVRSIVYDLKGDPDALVKFQKRILFYAARNEMVNAQDTNAAFGTERRPLNKTALKAPRGN